MISFQLISIFILISLLKGLESINNNSNSLFHNKCILKVGKIEEQTTKHGEIDFYQFASTRSVLFHMKKIKGNIIFNGYYAKNFSSFTISKEQFTYLRYLGNFDSPILLNDYSFLKVRVNEENRPENNEQYIIIAYCVDSSDCEYSIGFRASFTDFLLYEQQNYFSFSDSDTETNTTYKYQFNSSSISENSTLMVNIFMFNGNSSISIAMDGEKIKDQSLSFYSKDVFPIHIKKDNQIHFVDININQILSSFYGLFIYFKENNIEDIEEIIVENGYTLMNEIRLKEYKKFVINRNKTKNDLLFVVKSNNCILKIEKEENGMRDLITKDSFYQTIYSTNDTHSIFVSIYQFEDENYNNENDYCVFYSYSYLKNEGNGIILVEGIEQKIIFNEDIPSITFYYPLFYQGGIKNKGKFIEIQLPEDSKALVNIKFNNNPPHESNEYYIYEQRIFLLKSLIQSNCANNEICLMHLQVVPVLNEEEVTMIISLQAPTELGIHIPKNKLITSYYLGGTQKYNIFYTEVKHGDNGIIKLKKNYMGLDFSYSILERKTNTSTQEVSTNFDELIYQVNEKCLYGCELQIKVFFDTIETDTFYPPFQIAVTDKSKIILSPNYYQIEGIFSKNITYSYLYKLPTSIKRFQINLSGSAVSFTIKDLNETNPCCKGINQIYDIDDDNLFLLFEIFPEIDTSNYTIQLLIRPTQTEIIYLLPYYLIRVIPFKHLDMPIYYLSDSSELKCNTGENNRCRFIFKIEEGVPKNIQVRFFAFNPFKNEDDVFVYSNDIPEQYFFDDSLTWEDLFDYNEGLTLASQQHLNTFWGRSHGRGSNLFITVETISSQKEFKFSTLYIGRICQTKFNLLPFIGRSYSTSAVLTTSIIPHIPKGESIKKYQIVMNSRTVFLPYNFSVFDINVYSSHFINIVNIDDLSPIDIPIKGINFEMVLNYLISLRKNVFLTDLNLYTINSLYLNHSFPWEIAYKLGPNEHNFTLNIMINLKNERENFLNYSNYEIEAYYIDSDFINKRNNDESITKKYIKAEKASLNNNHITILNFIIDKEKRKLFDHIYIKIIEILPSNDMKNNGNDIILTIKGVTYPEKISSTPLYNLHFLFNYFSKESSNVHYYLIANPLTQSGYIKEFVFASCLYASDIYQVSFFCDNGTRISEDQIRVKYSKNGITKFRMKNDIDIRHIIVAIRINNKLEGSSNDKWFYGVKFMLYEKLTESSLRIYDLDKELDSKYNKKTKKIKSEWGHVVNQHKSIPNNLKFFYNIFENNTATSIQSICFPNKPVYQKILTDYSDDFEIDKAFTYKTHLIAYFIDDVNEEIFTSYTPKEVINNETTNIWIWIVVLFFFLLGGFIAVSSYYLYKQILKKKKEIDEPPLSIEINKKDE